MATHPCILAWEIPWTEKPGGLQSTASQRVGHDQARHGSGNLRPRRKSGRTPRAAPKATPQVAAAPVAWLCLLGSCWATEHPMILLSFVLASRWWVLSHLHRNLILLESVLLSFFAFSLRSCLELISGMWVTRWWWREGMFCWSWETLPRGEGAASGVSGVCLVLAANLGSKGPEKSFHCPEVQLPYWF